MNRLYLKVCAGLLGSLLSINVSAQQIEHKALQQLSENIQQHLNSQNAIEQYHAYKAQMWLSYAKNEFSENSLTVAGQEALEQSRLLAKHLSSATVENTTLTTPILSVSQVMRRDLWWQLEYFKQNGAIKTAPQALAEAEVMLVWAAAEYCELGWRHAKEHFFAVEQRLYQIKQSLTDIEAISVNMADLPTFEALNGQGCQGVNSNVWPITLQTPAVDLTNQALLDTEIKIENVVHFALDQAILSIEGQHVLNQIAELITKDEDLLITLVGYTDARANEQYNLALAQRRIDTVRDYLVQKGVAKNRIAEHAKGEQDLITDSNTYVGHAKSRRVVINFHNIDAKPIRVIPQWRDLQIETRNERISRKNVNTEINIKTLTVD